MLKNKQIKIQLFSLLKGKKFLYMLGLIGTSSFMFLFNVISGYGLKLITDSALNHNKNSLNSSIILMLLGILSILFVIPILRYTFESIYKTTIVNLKNKLYYHIQRLSLPYYETNQSGDLISRLNNDTSEVKNFFGDRLCNLSTAFISGIGSGILLYSLNWKLATLSIILGLLTIFANNLLADNVKKLNKEIQISNANSVKTFSNIINGFATIKLYNLSSEMSNNYEKSNKGIYEKNMKLNKIQVFLTGINCMIGTLSFIGIFIVGCYLVYIGEISMGTVLAVLQLRNGFNQMFTTISDYVTSVQKSYASAERIFEVFDEPDEYKTSLLNTAIPLINTDCNIVIKDVDFSYNDNRTFCLKNINIKVKKGEFIALVGPSGSGKSTLFKLLLKFYNINDGSIYIYNKNIELYSKQQIRSMFSYVQQDPYLFNGTIAENIGFGKENSSISEIVKASKMAFADDFIKTFPEGYNTIVGENGVKLSGGQKQRIAIARAFLKNSPFLLLDEATSALDVDSESKIQCALQSLIKTRTTIVIAHRLSTIVDANQIYVLKNGQIVESGTHFKLLKNSSTYKNLYKLQFSNKKNSCSAW